MTFFYDLNKKLDEIRATPSKTHGQLNERDMGKHNNATTGFAALAKKAGKEYGSKAAGERVAGAQFQKMKKSGKLEEQGQLNELSPELLKRARDKAGEKWSAADDRKDKKASAKHNAQDDKFNSALRKKQKDMDESAVRIMAKPEGSKVTRGTAAYVPKNSIAGKTPQGQAHRDATAAMAKSARAAGGKLAMNKTTDATGKRVPGGYDAMAKGVTPYRSSTEEGMGDVVKKVGSAVKKVGGAVLNKLGHGSDEDMRKDLQRKMGMPQTGKKPTSKYNTDPIPKDAVYDPFHDDDKFDAAYAAGKKQVKEKMSPARAQSFAALAPPKDKITFADKIAGAKKEVDEMLGDVAAEAIKGVLSGKQKQLDKNQNGKLDANDFAMLRKGGKKQVADEGWDEMEKDVKSRMGARKVGDVTHGDKHDTQEIPGGRRVTRRVDPNTGYSVGADSDEPAAGEKRGRGRPKGPAKAPERVTSKATKHKGGRKTNEGDLEITDRGEYDQEGEMAKDDIKTIVRHAQALEKVLGDNDNLPEWVQAKLAKIEGMMTAVDDYMQNQNDDEEMAVGEEKTSTRDNRAERAGRKVTKDIEYDEKKKDGIHGKKRGSEDARAEKAGKKVAKDIEYDEKKKKVKEAGGTDTPTASSGFGFGQGIYDSMNRELESMIAESMNISMSMNTDANGGPSKSITVTATDDDALKLGELLKNAGLGGHDYPHVEGGADMDHPGAIEVNGTMDAEGAEALADKIRQAMGDHDHEDGEVCDACGQEDCGCEEVDEAYGDDAVSQNSPDFPSNTETNDDSLQYSGGLNGPKSTGQTTIPVIASQDDRQKGYGDGFDEDSLARLREMAGIREAKKDVEEEKTEEGNLFTGNLAKARADGKKEADLDGDGDMEKVKESIRDLTRRWNQFKG